MFCVLSALNSYWECQPFIALIEKQLGYDWGATSVEDWIENDHAVEKDKRIVSQHFIDGESVLSSLKQIVALQRLCSDMNINLFTLKAYLHKVDRLFLFRV